MDEKEARKNESTLEEDFEQLEALLKEMERDDIGIEEAFDCYAKGMELIKSSNSKIDLVEKKVKLLSDNLETEDFES